MRNSTRKKSQNWKDWVCWEPLKVWDCTVYKLTDWSAAISSTVAEDRRFLGQRQRIYSQHSRHHVLHVHISFPCSTGPMEARRRWAQVDQVHTVGLCHRQVTLKFGNSDRVQERKWSANLCPRERSFSFFWTMNKTLLWKKTVTEKKKSLRNNPGKMPLMPLAPRC